jgi:hypothetical protein
MRKLALIGCIIAFAPGIVPALAQDNGKPKNEVTKLKKARKEDHTVRQVTPDPKKSPGKHADNLSKNVNHELNRESKDINHVFQGKKKHKKHRTH